MKIKIKKLWITFNSFNYNEGQSILVFFSSNFNIIATAYTNLVIPIL